MIASIKYHVAIKIAVINYTYSQWKDVQNKLENRMHSTIPLVYVYIIYFKD